MTRQLKHSHGPFFVEHFHTRKGTWYLPPSHYPPPISSTLWVWQALIGSFSYSRFKKKKKYCKEKRSWVGSRWSGIVILQRSHPTERFLASLECKLLSLVTLRETDSCRGSKLLKMTLILPFGETTMENEKYPLIWCNLNISQRHILVTHVVLLTRQFWLGSVQCSCTLSY